MPLLCPTCREPLDLAAMACANGHQALYEHGVLVLLDSQFAQRLRPFLDAVARFRADEQKRMLNPAVYPGLPFAAARDNIEWRMRCYDLAIVLRLLRRRRQQRILDIGAWNGWLSYRLAQQGHLVTALDYFTDEFDGLGAKKFYPADWEAIQLDLGDLSLLDQRYDMVILNRCVHFFNDPVAYVAHAMERVAPGGLLILTGLAFYRNPQTRAGYIAALQQRYRQRYGSELFLRPTRGYLDRADRNRLRDLGVALRSYAQLWLHNLKALLKPTLPWHCYGVCKS